MDPGTAILVAGAASSAINGVSTALTNAKNMKLAKYAYSKQLEMWNKQNEYNSPSNQMKRLAQAGLNPNLVYGNGQAVGNTTSDYPKFSAPQLQRYQNSEIMESALAYQNLQLQKAQIKNIEANTNKTNTETDKINAGRSYWEDNERLNNDIKALVHQSQIYSNKILFHNARVAEEMSDLRLEQLRKQNGLTFQQTLYLKQMAYIKAKEVLVKAQDVQNRFVLGKSQIAVNWFNARTNRLNANTNMFNAQTNRMNANTNMFNAQTNRMNANTNSGYLKLAQGKQRYIIANLAQNFLNNVTQGQILDVKYNTDKSLYNRYGKYGLTPNSFNTFQSTLTNTMWNNISSFDDWAFGSDGY